MKVAVFCSSRMGNRTEYAEETRKLGLALAEAGCELVYGGEEYGLMKVVADSVLARGGRVCGVIPNIPMMQEHIHPHLQEYVYVRDMAERKSMMMKLADAFIALPGGTGTLDELSEVLCQNKIGEMDKPLLLLNVAGYYDPLWQFLEQMVTEGMMDETDPAQLMMAPTASEAVAALIQKQ